MTPADILSTGEQQPRLPDDVGQVRDQEHAQPPVADVPEGFSLTPPAETEPTQTNLLRFAGDDADIIEAEARHMGRRWTFERARQDGRLYYRLLSDGRGAGSLTDAKHARLTIAHWRDQGWLTAEFES